MKKNTMKMRNGDSPLQVLMEDFHDWRLKEFPEYATTADVHLYNDRLETISLAKFDERKAKCDDFLSRLRLINEKELSSLDLLNYELLDEHLNMCIEGYEWRFHGACNPVTFLENTHINFKSYLIDATPLDNKEDLLNYVKRIKSIPSQISEQINVMREAIVHKTTLHRLSVERVPEQLTEIIDSAIEQNPFFEPCLNKIAVLKGIYLNIYECSIKVDFLFINFYRYLII